MAAATTTPTTHSVVPVELETELSVVASPSRTRLPMLHFSLPFTADDKVNPHPAIKKVYKAALKLDSTAHHKTS
jgi:hypothetical protein